MPREVRQIESPWSPDRVFAYLADFSNAQEWDPGVRTATRLDSGDLGVGSAFALDVSAGHGTRTMRYEITRYSPGTVTFRSRDGILFSEDTVTVIPEGRGSRVTYDAGLRLTGAASVGNLLLAVAFRRLVDRACAGLSARLGVE